MMSYYHNILAVIDNKNNSQSTILKAFALSESSDSNVTFLNLSNKNNSALITNPKSSSKDNINQHRFDIVHADNGREYATILEELNNKQYDLIIKNKIPRHHNYMGLAPSNDWKLLRNLTTPLMLVTDARWQLNGHLLSALETEESDLSHSELNKSILQHSYQLSKRLSSKVHLLNCYLGEKLDMSPELLSADKHFISEKQRHWQHLTQLLDNDMEDKPELHLQQGMPETEISLMADKYQVNMVVLGTAEHNNIINSFFGHTSEYIIDNLHCDVLAVKNSMTHH